MRHFFARWCLDVGRDPADKVVGLVAVRGLEDLQVRVVDDAVKAGHDSQLEKTHWQFTA